MFVFVLNQHEHKDLENIGRKRRRKNLLSLISTEVHKRRTCFKHQIAIAYIEERNVYDFAYIQENQLKIPLLRSTCIANKFTAQRDHMTQSRVHREYCHTDKTNEM